MSTLPVISHPLSLIHIYHGALGGSVISTVGAVGVCSILVYPGKIARYDLIYTEIRCAVYMIVNHVHDHTDLVVVKCFYHLFHLGNTDGTVVRIGGIGAFRDIIIFRCISGT